VLRQLYDALSGMIRREENDTCGNLAVCHITRAMEGTDEQQQPSAEADVEVDPSILYLPYILLSISDKEAQNRRRFT
jgi:hypothetical protein